MSYENAIYYAAQAIVEQGVEIMNDEELVYDELVNIISDHDLVLKWSPRHSTVQIREDIEEAVLDIITNMQCQL